MSGTAMVLISPDAVEPKYSPGSRLQEDDKPRKRVKKGTIRYAPYPRGPKPDLIGNLILQAQYQDSRNSS